jgi:hypothetical protein
MWLFDTWQCFNMSLNLGRMSVILWLILVICFFSLYTFFIERVCSVPTLKNIFANCRILYGKLYNQFSKELFLYVNTDSLNHI